MSFITSKSSLHGFLFLSSSVVTHPTICSTPADSLSDGKIEIHDPSEIDHARIKLGIHSKCFSLGDPAPCHSPAIILPTDYAKHGICGRAVLLDLVEYYTSGAGGVLPYDPWSSHAFSVADLEACAKKEGVAFRTGDILLIRAGFIRKYYSNSIEEKHHLGSGRDAEKL